MSLKILQCASLCSFHLVNASAAFMSIVSNPARSYIQGQLLNEERQYFYYIDHQGMVRFM